MKVGRYTPSLAERRLQEENDRLRDKNDALKQRIEFLSAESERYCTLYRDLLQGRTSPWGATRRMRQEPTIDLKSYMRPTESSKRRQSIKVSTLPSIVENLGDADEPEETLVSENDAPASSLLLPSELVQTPEKQFAWCKACRNLTCDGSDVDGSGCTKMPCTCLLCTHFSMKSWQGLCNDLCQRTRLNDSTFYATPEGRPRIRFEKVLKHMHFAHRLARDALWHALRMYWPNLQQEEFRYGPFQVRFGLKELKGVFNEDYNRSQPPKKCNEMCDMPPETVNKAILHLVYLRNALAHPSTWAPERADELMRDAQQLACVLRDEARAHQIRQLRDRLIEAVRKEYTKIVSRAPLSLLPNGPHWSLHTQRFFEGIAHFINAHERQLEWKRSSPDRARGRGHP